MADFVLAIEQPLEFLYRLELWLYGYVSMVINIGEFIIKLTIANINSSPINCLVWYMTNFTA